MLSSKPCPPMHGFSAIEGARSEQGTRGRSWTTLFLLGVLTFCAMSQAFRSAASANGIDFYQFWAVGRAVARHESGDIYSGQGRAQLGLKFLTEAMRSSSPAHRAVAQHRRVFDTTATPFLYTVFGRLSTDDYAASLRGYRSILLACFAFSVIGLAKLLGHTTTNMMLSLALLCLWFEPLASDLRVGNVGCLQLAGVVVYACLRLWITARFEFVLAGTWMGLLVGFKPNLVFVAILILLGSLCTRQWRALLHEAAGVALGLGVAIGYSAATLGSISVWFDWLAALRGVPDENITAESGNYSPLVVLRSHFGSLTKPALAMATAGAIALGLWARGLKGRTVEATTKSLTARRVVWLLSLGCLCPIVVPHLAWLHYFVLTVPALLVVLPHSPKLSPRTRAFWRGYLAVGAWLGLSINWFSMLGLTFTNSAYGTLVVLATYALLAATIASCDLPESVASS